MVLSGTVENIIFRNEENGYTVLDFFADGRLITAVGIFPSLEVGEALTLTGEQRSNTKYGEQFEVTNVTFDAPTDINGMIAYLGSGLFKGLGEITARTIVMHFGLKTLEIMEKDPMRLTEVRGIGAKKATEIAESYKKRIGMQNTILFLQKYGVTMGQALKIYQSYEDRASEILLENPYRLIDDIDGIGFITADKIAVKLGVERDSDFRIMAGISHILKEAANKNGHTFLPSETLVYETARLLETEDRDRIEGLFRIMLLNGKLGVFDKKDEENGGKAYALSLYSNTENAIAARLVNICTSADALDINVTKEVSIYEEQNDIYLHSKQKEAVYSAINCGALVITGGPGTGKTTIIKCILELLSARGLEVLLCAPTGRAAKRLSEASGRDAKTLHRMLGAEFSSGKLSYKHNELNPLEADAVIVDEISMADIFIFNAMLKALPQKTRLILVGDKDQLPSVSAGNILADVIASDIMPVISLTEIYRQDADSLIVVNAHRINNGEMPLIDNRSKDFFFDQKEDVYDIAATVVSMLKERIPRHFGIPTESIQVLSPVKRGTAGVENLNKLIQQSLNPNGREVTVNGTVFKEGDKVMHSVNNYTLKWERFGSYNEVGEGVFNGDIGYIKNIAKNGEMSVLFEDERLVVYPREAQDELMLAYAVSVHKSQGSEFPAVILVLSGSSYMLLSRNLLYTAVTRAKNIVVIVGSRSVLGKMVSNNFTAKRYTLLKDLIWENLSKAKMLNLNSARSCKT
ncbi:MAG: ATP-dependent RecD-like DNA helicase [Clostridia bacterium]